MNPFDSNPGFSNMLMPMILLFIIMISIGGNILEQQEPQEPQTILLTNNSNYKNVQSPNNGIVRLIKGKYKVIHHYIKEDSVIILSRKSLEGKCGIHLTIDIIPNESFTIKSVNENDTDVYIETEDYGEVYFKIY